METNLTKINELSKERENENWKFRSFLKGCDFEKIDLIVQRLYQQISSQIDCKTCANCCKETQPVLSQKDIETFSKGLRISSVQLKERYLQNSEEFVEEFEFNKNPCPFLKDNLCTNYAFRPKDCVSYPHLHKEYFLHRLMKVIENYSICPIVFNVYEALKGEVWHWDDENDAW
jgi:hypothetical protein